MAREIKFRAWDSKNKKWLDAVPRLEELLDDEDGAVSHHDISYENAIFRYPNNLLGDTFGGRIIWQQYTGLKDKNGREIFEGDIVEFYSGYPNQNDCSFIKSVGEVKYDEGEFWPRPMYQSNDDDTWYDYQVSDLKVIGNIFENPELLKE